MKVILFELHSYLMNYAVLEFKNRYNQGKAD